MGKHYSREKSVQIIVSLLKSHGIKRIITSPGATNVALVGSLQQDSFFELYSSVDERSAAYLACGLAAETNEPVVISCTGATASRNYVPGLTEAFYRKLPVLAITSTQAVSKVGHHVAQVIDRSVIPNDAAKLSVTLPIVKDHDDQWECEVKVNQAILELTRSGGGPVHINLPTTYDPAFDIKTIPRARVIKRVDRDGDFPKLAGRVAVFVGAHGNWSEEEEGALDRFCATNNAVVFCDHTSGYKGKYRVQFALAASQEAAASSIYKPDTFIHIGEISGDYETLRMCGENVWRVSPDGELRDTFRKLEYIFEMPESVFFNHYSVDGVKQSDSYLNECNSYLSEIRQKIDEPPFSNIWLASMMAHKIPENSTVHFGILNSLRSWNFFELPPSVTSLSNTGGFGIDGGLSSLVGASLANPNKLYFCVLGDLAFFYDMNVLGNRHLSNNIRILLVNNGKGTEFRNYGHHANRFGELAEDYMAASGHYGNKSMSLVKGFAESLGFEYISASSKEEFNNVYSIFLNSEFSNSPIVFEVFTDSEEESKALEGIVNSIANAKGAAKKIAKKVLGEKSVFALKKIIK